MESHEAIIFDLQSVIDQMEENQLKYIDRLESLEASLEKADKRMDMFSIGFADWLEKLTPSDRVSLWSDDGSASGLFNMSNKRLLEKYKKSLGTTKASGYRENHHWEHCYLCNPGTEESGKALRVCPKHLEEAKSTTKEQNRE